MKYHESLIVPHKSATLFTPTNILNEDVCLPAAVIKKAALTNNNQWMQHYADARGGYANSQREAPFELCDPGLGGAETCDGGRVLHPAGLEREAGGGHDRVDVPERIILAELAVGLAGGKIVGDHQIGDLAERLHDHAVLVRRNADQMQA